MQKNLFPIKGCHKHEMVPIMTSTEIASNAAVGTNNNSAVGTWSKPGSTTGIYRWVSADRYACTAADVVAVPAVRAATAVDLVAQVHAKSMSGGIITIDVILNAAATPTDPSAACAIEMVVWAKDSTVSP